LKLTNAIFAGKMESAFEEIRIGTRGSRLALWQANYLKDHLQKAGIPSVLKIIQTQGDRIQHLSFDKMEGKGFFTKEIEQALLDKEVDVAVHSMKDLGTTQPDHLVITAVSYREDPSDWLIIRKDQTENILFRLRKGGVVGTSSARRKAQFGHFRPDVTFENIRGNVPTRLQKLRDGVADGIILAAAGLKRLKEPLDEFEVVRLNPKEFIPAPAQGVLAFQTRVDDLATRRLLKSIHQSDTAKITNVERRVLQMLDGGCQLPLGIFCERDAMGHYHVWAALGQEEGAPLRTARLSSSTTHQLAEKVVAHLQK
jgi:hydroxymethylbilane synthase